MKQWSSEKTAAREITEGMEEVGIKQKVPGQVISSHSGRKTCVSAGMELGVRASVMQEWMLTASDQTERYRERDYKLNEEVSELFDFLKLRQQNSAGVSKAAVSSIFSGISAALSCCHKSGT